MLAIGVSVNVAQAFYQHVLKAGWGFAIDANVTLNTSYYGHGADQAGAFLITEEGMGTWLFHRRQCYCLSFQVQGELPA